MPGERQPEALQGIIAGGHIAHVKWEWGGGVETRYGKNLSTKHLSSGRLAGSRLERTWLNLYLECQQLNYYTAQRECACVCVCACLCVPVSVCVSVWSCAVKCTDGWLIHQSCDSSITAVTIPPTPPPPRPSEFFHSLVIPPLFTPILAGFFLPLVFILIVCGFNKLPL